MAVNTSTEALDKAELEIYDKVQESMKSFWNFIIHTLHNFSQCIEMLLIAKIKGTSQGNYQKKNAKSSSEYMPLPQKYCSCCSRDAEGVLTGLNRT